MPPIADEDRLFSMIEKMADRLGRLESRTAVIEDQNAAQLRELDEIKRRLSALKDRWDTKHSVSENDRRIKETNVSERLQRLETIVWLIGSTVSVLALILGGGVIVKFLGG
jgi:hypothetical protein